MSPDYAAIRAALRRDAAARFYASAELFEAARGALESAADGHDACAAATAMMLALDQAVGACEAAARLGLGLGVGRIDAPQQPEGAAGAAEWLAIVERVAARPDGLAVARSAAASASIQMAACLAAFTGTEGAR